MVVILTDGAMQDKAGVLALLEQRLGDTRLFVVSIGEDVQHETIRTIAAYGRGTAAFAGNRSRFAPILWFALRSLHRQRSHLQPSRKFRQSYVLQIDMACRSIQSRPVVI